MKTVILAGGYGTRISEESAVRPKPMIEIGSQPILWHIMNIYAAHGISEFIICCGYKSHVIKQYFADYMLLNSDVTFDLQKNGLTVHRSNIPPWTVTCVDTGESSMTGGRLRRVREYIGNETFCLTYGDGVSDVDISACIRFHKNHGKLATLTAVQPSGRFGALTFSPQGDQVEAFYEKPSGDGGWINGGFFVLEPKVIDYIPDDSTPLESEPMEALARTGNLYAWKHLGFWQPMDVLRDKVYLEELWNSGKAPWKIWEGGRNHKAPASLATES